MNELLNVAGPVGKKVAVARLRPKLEPRLAKEGLAWGDVMPALELVDKRPRGKNGATCATGPPAPIVLSTRQEGLMRPMMALPHDLRCIPTSLANKIPAASISRGGYRGGKTVPPPVTTSPIDRPFDRRGRHFGAAPLAAERGRAAAARSGRSAGPPSCSRKAARGGAATFGAG